MSRQWMTYLFGGGYLTSLIGYGFIFYQERTANVLSSLLFHITLFLLLYGGISILKDRLLSKELTTNLLLSLSVGCCFLFMAELSLRYVFRRGLTHSERVGRGYKSFYKNKKLRAENSLLFDKRSGKSKHMISQNEFDYLHQYNELGMRDQPSSVLLEDKEAFRIMASGDSFTEGIGVHQDSTWLKMMEAILNRSTNRQVTTFNFGFAGSDPLDALSTIEQRIAMVQPDLIIQAINQTDINDFSAKKILDLEGPWWEVIYANSILFRGILHTFIGYSGTMLSPSKYEEAKVYFMQEIVGIVDQLQQLQQQYDFQLVLLFHPMLPEFTSSNQLVLRPLVDRLEERSDLHIVNLMELFKKKGNVNPQTAQSYYWPRDGHHNPAGYQLWAEVLAEQLLEQHIISAQ